MDESIAKLLVEVEGRITNPQYLTEIKKELDDLQKAGKPAAEIVEAIIAKTANLQAAQEQLAATMKKLGEFIAPAKLAPDIQQKFTQWAESFLSAQFAKGKTEMEAATALRIKFKAEEYPGFGAALIGSLESFLSAARAADAATQRGRQEFDALARSADKAAASVSRLTKADIGWSEEGIPVVVQERRLGKAKTIEPMEEVRADYKNYVRNLLSEFAQTVHATREERYELAKQLLRVPREVIGEAFEPTEKGQTEFWLALTERAAALVDQWEQRVAQRIQKIEDPFESLREKMRQTWAAAGESAPFIARAVAELERLEKQVKTAFAEKPEQQQYKEYLAAVPALLERITAKSLTPPPTFFEQFREGFRVRALELGLDPHKVIVPMLKALTSLQREVERIHPGDELRQQAAYTQRAGEIAVAAIAKWREEVEKLGRAQAKAREAAQPIPVPNQIKQMAQAALEGRVSFDVLAKAVAAANQQIARTQAIQTVRSALGQLRQDGHLTREEFTRLAQAAQQLSEQTRALGPRWRGFIGELRAAEIRRARYEFLHLIRILEEKVPVLGLLVTPLATILRQINQLLLTGGPLGSLVQGITGAIGGLVGRITSFVSQTLSVAFGFVIGNILLAPFNLLGNAISNVTRNLDRFIRRGFELNFQQGKTREEIEKTGKVWDKFLFVLTRPAYDFAINKLKELTGQFAKVVSIKIADWEYTLLGLGAAIGQRLSGVLDYLWNFGRKIFGGGGPFDPIRWLEAGMELAGNFAAGLIQGFLSVVVPAVTAAATMVANFIIGLSPPPLGPLRNIILGGRRLIEDWMHGMLQADFSILDRLTSLVESRLRLGVAQRKGKGEAAIPGALIQAREIIAQALAEITLGGNLAAATLERLRSLFGDMFADVQRYLDAVIAWRNTQIALEAAQKAYNAAAERAKAVQEQIRAALEQQDKIIENIQNRIKDFEMATAEIPERFTRGRRRELELELTAAQRRRQEMQREGEQRMRLAQAEVEAAQKTLEAARKREQHAQREMQLLERLIQEEMKRNQLLAQQAAQKIGLRIDEGNLKAAAQKWQEFIQEHIVEPFQKGLGKAGKTLEEFFLALAGQPTYVYKQVGPSEGLRRMQTEASEAGSRLREALQKLFSPEAWEGVKRGLQDIWDTLKGIYKTLEDIKKWWDTLDPNAKNLLLGTAALQVTTGIPGMAVGAGAAVGGVKLLEGIWNALKRAATGGAGAKGAEEFVDEGVRKQLQERLAKYATREGGEKVAEAAVPAKARQGFLQGILSKILSPKGMGVITAASLAQELYFVAPEFWQDLIGKPLQGAFDSLGKSLEQAGLGGTILNGLKKSLKGGLEGAGGAIITLLTPIGTGMMLVGGTLAAGFHTLKGLGKILLMALTGGDVEKAKAELEQDLSGTFADIGREIGENAVRLQVGFELFKMGLSDIAQGIGDIFGGLGEVLIPPIQKAWEELFGYSLFPNILKGLWDFAESLEDFADTTREITTDWYERLVEVFNDFLNYFYKWRDRFTQVLDHIADALYQWLSVTFGRGLDPWFKYAYQRFEIFGEGIWNSMIRGLAKAAQTTPIANYLPTSSGGVTGTGGGAEPISLQHGGLVLRSGLAYVEQGELVIPRGSLRPLTVSITNNWPNTISAMDRAEFEELAERAAYRAIRTVIKR